ncbi:RxLR effector protein [Phytophthora megakarya]|uniref:RxLR effector protein n=1 Tax=Phytophthora megakarya TaxID=4795 RepID=A0A225V431_9STRA|nr:RxLR effector protein [Phytophthora megakarya]
MQLHYALLVVVTIFSTSANSSYNPDTESTKLVYPSVDHPLVIDGNDALPKRFLRNEIPTEEDDGERMIHLEKLKNVFRSRENGWLKAGLSTDETFKLLKLDEAGDKLLSNPNLKRWAVFVAKKTENSPEETMITKLRAQYDDATLATILQAGGKKWGTKNMATKLQNAQFKQWFEEGKWPFNIIEDVFKLGPGRWTDTPARPVWAAYNKFFEKNNLKVAS